MGTKTQSKQTLVLLIPVRRLNLARITDMQNRLHSLAIQSDQEIILDLRHVLWMDCSAVGCLVAMNRIAQANRSRLVLTNLTENVQLLADTLNLSKIIDITKKKNSNIHQISSNTQIVK